MTALPERVRYVAARYGKVVALGLILVGVVAVGTAAYDYHQAAQPTRVTEEIDRETVSLELTDSAVVTGDTELWPRGTRLVDHPVYLTGATPNLTLTARTRVPGQETVNVSHEVVLRVRAERDGNRFWQERTVLSRGPGTFEDGAFVTRTTIDVPRLQRERLATVRDAIGGTGTVVVTVEARSRYVVDGSTHELVVRAPLRIGDSSYEVGGDPTASRTHSTEVTRTRVPSPTPTTGTLMRAGLGLVALLAGLAVGGYHVRTDLDSAKRRLERARYAEWLSAGRVPVDAGEVTVPTDSLTDLVDVAVDCDARVIHDETRDLYAAFDDRVVYVYRDTEEGIDSEADVGPTAETARNGAGDARDELGVD